MSYQDSWSFCKEMIRMYPGKRLLHLLLSCNCVVYWPSTRPNMPFQSDAPERSDTFRWLLWEGLLYNYYWFSYYITQWGQKVRELEIRWGRESHHPTEGAIGTPSEFWKPEPLVTRCDREIQRSAESWAPGSPVEHQENKKDTTLMAIRVGVNMLQFCSVSNSLSHITFQIKWEVYFFKVVFARRYYRAVVCWPERNTTIVRVKSKSET